jgi:hypothetical protein
MSNSITRTRSASYHASHDKRVSSVFRESPPSNFVDMNAFGTIISKKPLFTRSVI